MTLPPDKRVTATAPIAGTRGGKARYDKPRLIDYGSVSKLTQTGGITTADNKTMKQPCL